MIVKVVKLYHSKCSEMSITRLFGNFMFWIFQIEVYEWILRIEQIKLFKKLIIWQSSLLNVELLNSKRETVIHSFDYIKRPADLFEVLYFELLCGNDIAIVWAGIENSVTNSISNPWPIIRIFGKNATLLVRNFQECFLNLPSQFLM